MKTRFQRSRLAVGAGLVGLALIATGCGGGGGGGGKLDRQAQTKECPPVTKQVDESEHLTWIYSVDNSSFDPDHITTNNSVMYLLPIYDSLVHMNAVGEPEPMLATSWKVSKGGNQLTMKLIDNWSYHDGTPFDADSVVANIERSQEPGGFNVNALSSVTGVKALDEHTVQFTLDDGSAGALVGILSGAAGMMMSPKVFDDPKQDVRPTGGSGAYRLTKFVSGSKAEYRAVDDYWDPEGQNVASMTYLVSGDDNARLNSVLTGDADTTFLRASMYDAAVESGNVVCEAPSLSSYQLTLNTKRSEFGSKQVREALNYAIDRNAVSAVTDGFLEPGVQMFPEWYWGSNESITAKNTYQYDPEKARQLLVDAGLKDGFSFELEVINLEVYQQIAEVIQANLADVGIKMSITPVEIDALAENFSVSKDVDAQLSEQKGEADPSTLTASYYHRDSFNNPGGWGTKKIEQLDLAARRGATTDAREPLYDKLFAEVMKEVPHNIVLGHLTTPFVMNDRTLGVEIYADGTRSLRGVGKLPAK